jgi:hypothetical protein
MRPTSGDYETREGLKPYIEDYLLHLPDAYDDWIKPSPTGESCERIPGVSLYRAAAAHCAAHIVETRQPISAEGLNPLQMAAPVFLASVAKALVVGPGTLSARSKLAASSVWQK